jgi:DNA-binding CsgD family transcriptional regulator
MAADNPLPERAQPNRRARRRADGGLELSPREREVLARVQRGEQNKEIALGLGVSKQFAKELVSNLLRKFEVPNRAALAEVGSRLELVGESIEPSWLPQLFRGASVQIAVTRGPEHRYVVANAAFTKATGRDVVGKTMRESFPELERSGYFALADRVYQTGESFVGHEAAATWDRGRGPELTYTDGVLQALRGDSGEIDGLVFFAMDVTEQVTGIENVNAPRSRASSPDVP